MFAGSFTALVTPFRNGAVDEGAFCDLVEWQIAEGAHGLVPCGTTGESATLTHDEHKRVIELCVKTSAGRIPVIAGTGSNNTLHAIEFTEAAKGLGADAALSVAPYYNKPSQEGLYAHFSAVADKVELPTFVYNIPGRSVVDVSEPTMARLAQHPNIIGVKDATGDLARVTRTRRDCGADFIQLSGEDGTALGFNAHGGVGAISVTANVAPRLCAQFQDHCLNHRYVEARALHDQLMRLHDALFCAPNPVPTKYVLSRVEKMTADVRLPHVPIPDEFASQVYEAFDQCVLRHAERPA